jgi:hyaluronan synthase
VQPFHDRSVGAVAGHTRVIVEKNNVISKMESVRYFISHQLFKTAESIFGAVTCCPGAFSAYRRDVVLRVLPQWLNQTFLGVKSTFGDDRSLTNHVLRTHRVLYHSAAICVTFVPTSWKQFFTQQLRWKKSWARETTVAARVLLRKHPLAVISYYVGVVVTLLSPLVFLRAVVVGPMLMGTSCVPYLLGVIFIYLFLCLFFLFQTGETHWPYGLLFAVSYLSILCWQTYWAILTINKTKWGTR